MSTKGGIYVLSGPSGCGKNTVYDELRKRSSDIAHTVSATTRAARDGEVDGRDYYFVSVDDFLAKVGRDEFVEYVSYGGNYYGTLRSEVDRLVADDKKVVLVIEVNGAFNIKKIYPDAVSVFLLPPSVEVLRHRLEKRGQNTPEEIERRITIAEDEMKIRNKYDYNVVNADLDKCVDDVYNIIFR